MYDILETFFTLAFIGRYVDSPRRQANTEKDDHVLQINSQRTYSNIDRDDNRNLLLHHLPRLSHTCLAALRPRPRPRPAAPGRARPDGPCPGGRKEGRSEHDLAVGR